MSTDINVDGLHQRRLSAITHDNPFGEQFSMEMDEFIDLYKLISNTATPNHGSSHNSNKRRRNHQLSEIQKVAIALEMWGGHDWMYKYRPQHVIYNELCMVLQKRAFSLETLGQVMPIPIENYRPNNTQHVLVRELAFGPDSDSTVRGVALWFNIPENEVSECTPQQAKRFRWRKKPTLDEQQMMAKRPSIFDSRECFTMVRPCDRDAFAFAHEILQHRHDTIRAERLSTLMSERFEALKELRKQKEVLQKTFQNHKRHWMHWAWPISIGRQCIDNDTPVPPVDGHYKPLLDEEALLEKKASLLLLLEDSKNNRNNHYREEEKEEMEWEPVKGAAIEPIWNSFVTSCSLELQFSSSDENAAPPPRPRPNDVPRNSREQQQEPPFRRRRLPIFAKLADGEEVCLDQSLPHILKQYNSSTNSNTAATTPRPSLQNRKNTNNNKDDDKVSLVDPSHQSELCWKALMLEENKKKKKNPLCSSKNEWEIVRDHFQNARCKKVLTILQK